MYNQDERKAYIVLNPNGPGVENVMNPTKYANIVRPIPFARTVVGNTSDAQTKDGPSINWNSTMKKKMKTTQAMFPPLLVVSRNFHCKSASARRSHASIGKPITG
jgi:hypothetical protein